MKTYPKKIAFSEEGLKENVLLTIENKNYQMMRSYYF